jgi:RNA polymerase sigma factor (sigma-70 family)
VGRFMDFDGLEDYKYGLGECPVLTREEELQAVAREDFDTLIMSQMPWLIKLSHSVCAKWRFHDLPLLISAATLALTKAVRKFDTSHDCRLTTYVCRPVLWTCYDELRRSRWGCAPRDSKGPVVPTELWGNRPPMTGRDSDFMEQVDNREISQFILESLNPREADVLWSIAAGEGQIDIAKRYGVSRQRINQIKDRALTKARQCVQWQHESAAPAAPKLLFSD